MALRNAVKETGDVSSEVCDCYLKLASVCSARAEHGKALGYYQEALNICNALYQEDNEPKIACVMNIANAYRKDGKLDLAQDYSKRATDMINENTQLSDHIRAKMYGSIGNFYSSMKQNDKALSYYLQADTLLKSCQKEHPLEAITTLCNIGHAYLELGQYDKALVFWVRTTLKWP